MLLLITYLESSELFVNLVDVNLRCESVLSSFKTLDISINTYFASYNRFDWALSLFNSTSANTYAVFLLAPLHSCFDKDCINL